jgi:hypothetical protein
MKPALLKLAKQMMAEHGFIKPRCISNRKYSAAFTSKTRKNFYRLEAYTCTGIIGVDVFKLTKEIRHVTPLGE